MGVFGKKAPPPREPGCCASFSRALCSGILATIFLSICGLSVAALVGKSQYWAYYTHNAGDPGAYNIQSGWLDFATRDTDRSSLLNVNYGLWVIGAFSAAALLLSAVLAAIEFFLAVCNNCGRHTAGLAFPTGIILTGILICYIVAAVFEFRAYTSNNVGQSFTIWPSWGWICAIIAGVLWFLAGICASCMGLKRPRAAPLPAYQQQPAAYTPPAPGTYPGAGAGAAAGTTAAVAPAAKRGWFGRRQAVPTTGPAPEQYTAQPFNQPAPGRDVEMGNAGIKHNGHAGEAAAAGVAGGAAAGMAAGHHRRAEPASPPGPLAQGAQAEQPKKRGLFGGLGRKKANAAAAGDYPAASGAGARGRRVVQTPAAIGDSGAVPDQVLQQQQQVPAGTAGGGGGAGYGAARGVPDQAPGGAWSGSRLGSDDVEAPRGAWAGTGHRDTDVATGAGDAPMTDVPLHNEPPAAAPAASVPGKKSIFSFYH